jgi:hypothetical protein
VNVDPHLKREYVQSWNLNVQKALPGQMVLDVGYQGSRMLHGPQQFNINQSMTFPNTNNLRPNTPFTTITSTISSGESRYNSLQVKLKKPLNNSLLFTVNYTWSKTMDNLATVLFGNSGADYWHRDNDWGPTDYGRAHVLTSDFIYILPVGSGRRWMSNVKPVVNGFLGGWQLTGIATLMSGPGLTILSSSAQASLNVVRPVRADCTAGHGELSNRSADEWFNTADFSMPPNTRTGNCGRNILTGPPTVNFDLGLYKNFHLSEATSLQFRMEAFDAFNHQQWNTPGLDVNAPATFGKILGTSGERQLQLALRLEF